MTRVEIIENFRVENPDATDRVITDAQLYVWCQLGDKEICAITRCIVDDDGTEITTAENDQRFDLTNKINKFFDIDDYPSSGVTYNGKKLEQTTMAKLDDESINWRSRSSGTPLEWYRKGKWLYLDRKIDSNAYPLKVYSVLISDDFNNDNLTPYNQLTYLEPFHGGILKYLQWRAKAKIGKPQDAATAKQEFFDYANWMKKLLAGNKYSSIFFRPKI